MNVGDVVFYIEDEELKIGTVRLIEKDTHVFLIGTPEFRYKEDLYTLERLKAMAKNEEVMRV